MKKLLLLSVTLVSSGVGLAQEVGRVISSTPIIEQVNTPRQVCTTEAVAVRAPRSGAGALMGAIAGGAMGNAIGGGAGTVAATMLGIVGGAAIGDQIEGQQSAQIENVQHCSARDYLQSRPVAYNVVYEYGGRQYSVQMPTDPGPTVQLQVTPVGARSQTTLPVGDVAYSQPVYEQPRYVVIAPPSYPVYYQPDYVMPFALGLGIGYLGGYGGHRHGRWR